MAARPDPTPTVQPIASFPENPQPPIERIPVQAPDADVRPKVLMALAAANYLQGGKRPATSSVLISSSKHLNDPYYRDAVAQQATRRHGHDLPPPYMIPVVSRAITETTDFARFAELLAAEKVRMPALGEWLDAREDWTFNKADLAGCDEGTLGREIFDLMSIPGVNMEFAYAGKASTTDAEYLQRRRGYYHDIEHIVSGFDANSAGEAALAIMNATQDARFFTPELAQYLSAPGMWVSALGLFRNALHYHHVMPTYFDATRQGIAAGQAIRQPMFLIRWIDYIDWQLDDIAAHLGFERGPGRAWQWTTDATMD
ncbi:hypothetical protein [Sphingomonas montanisoli]|uniref:Ubiquinone biosynthesis protein n=1 Tax=Sphingomonas montanisoli TaxID=2606412 RepID=A0A5D9CBI5_9SPHN|nr:hypothetical protein [Sphingomonas montanisoli]TZG28726.1 hypothetical protein FYJ91_00830 [Sphingomonas montanisoli]